MASGGRPTANIQANGRVTDNKKRRTEMQSRVENTVGMNVNRNAKDRNNTSLADLARQYTRESERARGTYRLASLRRSSIPQTRYNSSVRTGQDNSKIGTVRGVGTTTKKRYVTVQGGTNGMAQPSDSGNGNSPIVVGGSGLRLRSTGVYGSARAYLNSKK